MCALVPIQDFVSQFLATFKEFRPHLGSSLSVDQVLQTLTAQGSAVGR